MMGMELTAFFPSRQCPGAAIRAALDWAVEQARNGRPVIGGFATWKREGVSVEMLSNDAG